MFKWNSFAFRLHLIGTLFHVFYIGILVVFIYNVYVSPGKTANGVPVHAKYYQVGIILGVIYPMCYDFRQMYNEGIAKYFSDPGNALDLLYIWGSVANVVL